MLAIRADTWVTVISSDRWSPHVFCSSELTLQLPDPLQAKTVQSEVRRGAFTLPIFQRGQVLTLPARSCRSSGFLVTLQR